MMTQKMVKKNKAYSSYLTACTTAAFTHGGMQPVITSRKDYDTIMVSDQMSLMNDKRHANYNTIAEMISEITVTVQISNEDGVVNAHRA